MKREDLFEVLQDVDEAYVAAAQTQKKRRRYLVAIAAAAACLALVLGILLPRFGREAIALSDDSKGAHVYYVNQAPLNYTSDASLIPLTEDEMFTHWDTAIFRGTVTELRNIVITLGGHDFYKAIARIAVEEVYRGPLKPGDEATVLLSCAVSMDGFWAEDSEVLAQLRTGMTGIFMPIVYTRENSFFSAGGDTLIQKDLADFGMADGVRWAFLETDHGLVYDRSAFPGLTDPSSLDDVAAYLRRMIEPQD